MRGYVEQEPKRPQRSIVSAMWLAGDSLAAGRNDVEFSLTSGSMFDDWGVGNLM